MALEMARTFANRKRLVMELEKDLGELSPRKRTRGTRSGLTFGQVQGLLAKLRGKKGWLKRSQNFQSFGTESASVDVTAPSFIHFMGLILSQSHTNDRHRNRMTAGFTRSRSSRRFLSQAEEERAVKSRSYCIGNHDKSRD